LLDEAHDRCVPLGKRRLVGEVGAGVRCGDERGGHNRYERKRRHASRVEVSAHVSWFAAQPSNPGSRGLQARV
jgi:hypothetical protein